MKKTHWLIIVIGGIVLWAGTILCYLVIIQLGSEYQIEEELLDASEEAYRFNPQTVLSIPSPSEGEVFIPIPFQEDILKEPTNVQVLWRQEEYFHVIDLLMQTVLHEQLKNWRLNSVASKINCAEPIFGQVIPQGMSVELFREIKTPEQKMRQDLHIIIDSDKELIIVFAREYYSYAILDYIEWTNFKIPIEQALTIADQQGGAKVRTALNNHCEIRAILTAGIQKDDWQISYEPYNKPSVFEVAVDEKTGKYRILREFGK